MGFFSDGYFDPRSLNDFDGRSWGGVRLGETTRDEFKRRYKTKGGKFVRPEALIVTPASGALGEIQALTDGTGGDARVTAFYVAFGDRGTRLDRLEGGELRGGETWYPEPRFSDWHVLAYPRSGTALMVVREDDDRVPFALLTTPSRLERLLDGMQRDRTPVQDIRGRFDRLDRTVEVGTVTVTLSRKDLRLRNEEFILAALRLRARREIESDAVRYDPRGRGSVNVYLNIVFRDDSNVNYADANATLIGTNERGRVSASGYGRASLDRRERRASDQVGYAVQNAYLAAINDLRRQAERNVDRQKSPSSRDYRTHAFVALIDAATR